MYRPSPSFEAFMMGIVSFITSLIVWMMAIFFLGPWVLPATSSAQTFGPLVFVPPLLVALGVTVATYRNHASRTI